MRNSHARAYKEEPADFNKVVLNWPISSLDKPFMETLSAQPLPKYEHSLSRYYKNFMPFILEEARAIVADGLTKVRQYYTQTGKRKKKKAKIDELSDAIPFNIKLKQNPKFPKNSENPFSVTFSGSIPKKIEHSRSMNALLLKPTKIEDDKWFFGLALERSDTNELVLKLVLSVEDISNYGHFFKKNVTWQVHYLGSLTSESRMYETCLTATDNACVRKIAASQINQSYLHKQVNLPSLNHLNLSQQNVIRHFFATDNGSTTLLQGPPGTGKTTTIVELLKHAAKQKKRTLVSAHSNKGVQVLATRALHDPQDIPILLVGVENKIPESLWPISLNRWHEFTVLKIVHHVKKITDLVENHVGKTTNALHKFLSEIDQDILDMEQRLKKYDLISSNGLGRASKRSISNLNLKPIAMSDFQDIRAVITKKLSQNVTLIKHWKALLERLDALLSKWQAVNKTSLEEYLLDYATIIFATLVTSGRRSMSTMQPVEFLFVDEAAQSVEPTTLIPIRYQPKKILLVGDTKQLPATVISTMLNDSSDHRKNYQWSMMWRLIEENDQFNMMLTTQYRMHPQICQWPSSQYYADRLATAPDILPMALFSKTGITSRPYAIYHISGADMKSKDSKSVCNKQEAQYVVNIITQISKEVSQRSIGVITPYVAQKNLIKENLAKSKCLSNNVNINTVDSFQGDERDIIIISFVRTHVTEFLREFRRLNVAITRPKCCLIILASPNLASSDIGEMITDACKRNLLFTQRALNNILSTGQVQQIAEGRHSSSITIESCAWQGDANSQFQYAQQLAKRNKKMAFVWYRRAAENNCIEAQYYISQAYLSNSYGITKDNQVAIKWLAKSAQYGFAKAQYTLSQMLLSGEIVKKDKQSAFLWCKKAADNNFLDALVKVANYYEEGVIVGKDIKLAQQYYRQAAKLDHIDSVLRLATILSDGTLANQREALKWYKRLAHFQIEEVYYPIARLLEFSLGKKAESFEWYIKAADVGELNAQYNVGISFSDGSYGNMVDLGRSAFYLNEASLSGHTESQFLYANYLKLGTGMKKDLAGAMKFYKKAADKGHIESQYQYALLVESQSVHTAYKYYKQAAKKQHEMAQDACVYYQIIMNHDLDDCLRFCKTLADSGNSQMQFLLARLLHSGIAGRVDKLTAKHCYLNVINGNNHYLAEYYYATLLEEDVDNQHSINLAKHYFKKASVNYSLAKIKLGRLLLQDKDYFSNQLHAITMIESVYENHSTPDVSDIGDVEANLEKLIANKCKFDVNQLIFSIETDSTYANYALAMMLQRGNHAIHYSVQIESLLQKAADAGDAESQYQLAILLEKRGYSHRAYLYYQQSAQQQHVLSQEKCVIYQITFNLELSLCLDFCKNLYTEGKSIFLFITARLLDSGVAGELNKKEAFFYYQQAAKQEHTVAKYYCAKMLALGSGVDSNINLAIDYYQDCSNKYVMAKLHLAYLLLSQCRSDISYQQVEARTLSLLKEYYQHDFNHSAALLNPIEIKLENVLQLRGRNEDQSHVIHDISNILSEITSSEINFYLGKIFEEGKGVEVNIGKAIYYYQQAADMLHLEANYCLGYIYEFGIGQDSRDRQLAKRFYQKAADQGHELATSRLSLSYSLLSNFRDYRDESRVNSDTQADEKSNECCIM